MNLSYWEYKTWLSNIDFTIVGSGIVGLNCALTLKNKFPKAKIIVLEKGILPQGASTKNAGFACYGSISEVLSDLDSHSEEEVLQLVEKRKQGIELLRKNLGDTLLDYQQLGGHELFVDGKEELFQKCVGNLEKVNELLKPVFGTNTFEVQPNQFAFNKIKDQYITNIFEGQIDTGKMMQGLLKLVLSKGIAILNAVTVQGYENLTNKIVVKTNAFEFDTNKLFIATNGFALQLLKEKVTPARAQVLITEPIPNLQIKGTFHLDEGYYYFRNIDSRILFGGGRNLDFKGEETFEQGKTKQIQSQLEKMLAEIILPGTSFEIERRWSGIMGVGTIKNPIIKQLSNNVYCGVRLGGMGVAIGSHVGENLANLTG